MYAERSVLRPSRFNPGERPPGTHCIGECVGHWAGPSGCFWEEKNVFPLPGSRNCPVAIFEPRTWHTTHAAVTHFTAHLYRYLDTVAMAAKTLCNIVVEFLDRIRIVYFKSVRKLHSFCTLLCTVHCDTETEGNNNPRQYILLLLFPLWTAADFPALSCPVSCFNMCQVFFHSDVVY